MALGFLDFSTLDARRSACEREVELNRRLAPDMYLGVVDVHDAAGDTVDVAVEMCRLPDDRRLATLAAAGADAGVAHDRNAGADAYRPDVTAATYAELLRRAERLLGMGESVVLDASWSAAGHRAAAADVAARTHSELWQLRCDVAPEVAHARLAGRAGDASDATATVHDRMAVGFATWDDAVVVATAAPPDVVADAVDRTIGLPPDPDE